VFALGFLSISFLFLLCSFYLLSLLILHKTNSNEKKKQTKKQKQLDDGVRVKKGKEEKKGAKKLKRRHCNFYFIYLFWF